MKKKRYIQIRQLISNKNHFTKSELTPSFHYNYMFF